MLPKGTNLRLKTATEQINRFLLLHKCSMYHFISEDCSGSTGFGLHEQKTEELQQSDAVSFPKVKYEHITCQDTGFYRHQMHSLKEKTKQNKTIMP